MPLSNARLVYQWFYVLLVLIRFQRRDCSPSCWQIWAKIAATVGDDIRERCIGEMTGADRALISSLEGFEDLQLIGRLQLQQHAIARGDTIVCVTEGGASALIFTYTPSTS